MCSNPNPFGINSTFIFKDFRDNIEQEGTEVGLDSLRANTNLLLRESEEKCEREKERKMYVRKVRNSTNKLT